MYKIENEVSHVMKPNLLNAVRVYHMNNFINIFYLTLIHL